MTYVAPRPDAGAGRASAPSPLSQTALTARRRRVRRRCARRRLVVLLVFVALTSFLGTLAIRFLASPAGFDYVFRPDHLQSYSDAALRFSMRYPARLTLDDTTGRFRERGDVAARLVLSSDDDSGALDLTVHAWSWEKRFSRSAATDLVLDLRAKIAAALPRDYGEREGIRRVVVQGVRATTVGGLPAIASRATLKMKTGRDLYLERSDCFPGEVMVTFESIFARGDTAMRDRLRGIVASFRHDPRWRAGPHANGSWVMAVPSSRGGIVAAGDL